MEENKNIPTTEGEVIAPEAPVTDIPGTDAPPPDLTAGVPRQEQTGATMAEPGDVVVSFDKIEELMAERRAAARDTVEKAEPEVDAPAVEPVDPIPDAKEAEKTTEEKPQEEVAAEQKKSRRGRSPKAEKAEQAAPEAGKEQTAAKPRRGRPPKADKAAPDEAQPPKPRDKVELLTKCLTIYYERKNGSKKDAHRRHPIHLIILFKFKAVAERRQWSSAASKPRRKTRVKLCPHF